MDNSYYVYMHIANDDPNLVLYIGKGKLKRDVILSSKRSLYWNNIVEKHGGYKSIRIAENLSEESAYDLEWFLIQEWKAAGMAKANLRIEWGRGAPSGDAHFMKNPEHQKYMSDFLKQYYKDNPDKKLVGELHPNFGNRGEESFGYGNKSHTGRFGGNHTSAVAVFRWQDNGVKVYYAAISDAERETGVDHENIVACCNNRRNAAGKDPVTGEKYYWCYIDDYDKAILIDRHNHANSRKLVSYTESGSFSKEFNGASQAGEFFGINHKNISAVLIGSRRTAGKYNGEKLLHKYLD